MSRAQEGQVVNTASGQNQTFNQNAQQSYTQAQGDIGNYENQLSQFAAANPYGAGGQYQADVNRSISNTAAGAGQSAGQALQGAAVRTGQNAGGAIAATEAMQQQNQRDVSSEEAQADAQRLQSGAQYGQQVLTATGVPAQLEQGLTSTEAGAGNSALGVQQSAAQTPSFLDELGQGLISAGGQFAGAAGKAIGGCWIAKELYGSWTDTRVILLRVWLWTVFRKRWYGPTVLWLYSKYGEWVAARIPVGTKRRAFFQWLFDAGVEAAERWCDAQQKQRINENGEVSLGL